MSTLRWQSLRVRVSLLWLACEWLLALPAFAQPRIDWQATAGCPSVDEGRAQIEQLLRAPLSALAIDLRASVRLRRDSGSAFTATIEVQQDGVARTRVLHSADCAVLAHTSAVIVALAIDPAARLDAPSSANEARDATAIPAKPVPRASQLSVAGTPPTAASAVAPRSTPNAVDTPAPPPAAASAVAPRSTPNAVGTPAPPPAAASAVVPRGTPNAVDTPAPSAAASAPAARRSTLSVVEIQVPPTAASESTVPRSAPSAVGVPVPSAAEGGNGHRLQLLLGIAPGLDAGTLPKPAPALALFAGLDTRWSRIALRLTYAPAQRATASELPGASGRVGLSAAAMEAGLHWHFAHLARIELSSLVGLEAGAFAARGGEGVSDQATRRPFWLGCYLAGRIALLATANFSVSMRVDGIVALRRPSFVLRGDLGEDRTLHRPSPVSGRCWLELEVHFPL